MVYSLCTFTFISFTKTFAYIIAKVNRLPDASFDYDCSNIHSISVDLFSRQTFVKLYYFFLEGVKNNIVKKILQLQVNFFNLLNGFHIYFSAIFLLIRIGKHISTYIHVDSDT